MTYNYTQGDNSIILHAPHGGLEITGEALSSLIIDENELNAELLNMTDLHTDRLALDIRNQLLRSYDHSTVVSTFINKESRLVIDPERFPDEREEMNAVGMGAVYTHGSQGQQIRSDDAPLREWLIAGKFVPYAQGLEEAVTRNLRDYSKTTIIDIHSYASKALPYELHKSDTRPEICIGVDNFHSPTVMVENVVRILEQYGYETSINSPFSGTYVPLKYYGSNSEVSSIMLELRRDIYMDETNGVLDTPSYNYLLHALTEVVDGLI